MQTLTWLVLCGLPATLYGLGMIYFNWVNPGSRFHPFFKPRWRFGIKAKQRSAYAQVLLMLSFGAAGFAKAFQSTLLPLFGVLVIVFGAVCLLFFLADWLQPDVSPREQG